MSKQNTTTNGAKAPKVAPRRTAAKKPTTVTPRFRFGELSGDVAAAFADTPGARWLAENFDRTPYNEPVMPPEEVLGCMAELAERIADVEATLAQVPPALEAEEGAAPPSVLAMLQWAPGSAVERERDAVRALGELLGTEAFVKLTTLGGEHAPDRLLESPRLGFTPPDSPERRHPVPGLPGYERHVCELTERPFALPNGAPVPALLFDVRTAEDGERWADSLTVHPRIYVEGASAVYRALWAMVMRRVNEAAEELCLCVEYAAAACYFWPENIGAEPGSAFYDAVERAGRKPEHAAPLYTGWQDLAA